MAPITYLITLFALAHAALSAPSPAKPIPINHYPINTVNDLTTIQGPDGLYTSHNGTHMAYHGEAPPKTLSVREYTEVNQPRDVLSARDGCSTNCNRQFASGPDISKAHAGLRAHFVSYPSWSGHIVYVYGNVYAFGCDYGHGQSTPPTQYDVDVDCVYHACGPSQGGWNSRRSWKATYGREIGGYRC